MNNKILLGLILIITNSVNCDFTLRGIIRPIKAGGKVGVHRQSLNVTVSSNIETYGQLMDSIHTGSGSFYLLDLF